MTGIATALYELWSGFTLDGEPIPAYKSGHVPDHANFPYFTFTVQEGAFLGRTVQTAFLWIKHDEGVDADGLRGRILDDVARAIPEGGRMLITPNGGVMLWRNDANFLSTYEPEGEEATAIDGAPVIGGRVSYITQFYEK